MSSHRSHFKLCPFLWAAAAVTLLTFPPKMSLAQGRSGAVYVMTNQPTGNAVIIFHRDAAGVLAFAGSFASGGKGAGTGVDPLGSQDSLVLSEDNRLLFAVNAGSNTVSVFAVSQDQLTLLDTVSSGGTRPVSLTVKNGLVYVLNSGGTPNISGFTFKSATNRFVPLAGSTQQLPGGFEAGPAQVSLSHDIDVLVVTEKGTNLIDTFTLDDDGFAQPGVSFVSNGSTPFGFAFGHNNVAIVSEAFGGAPGASALSSYKVDEDGRLVVVSPSLRDTQTAACWVVVPQNGRFAYTSNTGSGTISSYAVSEDGRLALLKAVAASTGAGSGPTDMTLSQRSRFLYVRNGGNGTISGFRVQADGSLTAVSTASGLPAGAAGIAAR